MTEDIASFTFEMNKIRILPDILSNQIAAGEVVERPASVIKELVENSIDAGANRIQIDIELGGRRLMRVSDNGSGMTRDDAVLAFERHATSKIRTLEDLGMIATLGFRGEALASISSVARVELLTKMDREQAGTRVLLEGGRLIDVKDAARDTGTTLAVRDLFFNTPARRKFMRSEATENYHLTGIVTHYALAHPEVAFSLTNNGREVISVAPARDLRERAFQLFGGQVLESLLPVSGGREFVARLSGFISAPRERRTNRDSQYFFVNKRYVRDRTIAEGLREGYRSVLPHGVYPVAFLFVDVPVEEIDVNVHPAKTEIRFRRNEAVKDVIAEAVRESLASAGIGPDAGVGSIVADDRMIEEPLPAAPPVDTTIEQIPIAFHPASAYSGAGSGNAASMNAGAAASPVRDPFPESDVSVPPEVTFDPSVSLEFEEAAQRRVNEPASPLPQGSPPDPQPLVSFDLPPLQSAARLLSRAEIEGVSGSKVKVIGQLHDSFIIAVDDEGLLLIDQHVAHERILFDRFRKKEAERPLESQNLLLPETVDLTPAQAEAFRLVEDNLAELGFGLMQLSGRTVAIKSIPTDVQPADARNLFAEILDSIELEKRGSAKAAFRDEIAASLACKAAIKINMKLTDEKMHWLIDRLLMTSSPTTCPHGRPVILRLSMKDIERGFHRT
ncbi:MAG TPA: DNA mismatch repair endonuclease MutL [Pyrinomonadaceae bacterium]|nr:DNA mismatch repair endonuclease MutL [Pyrinomonadaceae bacterium]